MIRPYIKMKVRQKSLWRSKNVKLSGRTKKFANMRAAKEHKRLARLARDEPPPDLSHTYMPRTTPPLFVVSIRCRDGERVSLPIHETPHGLSVSATLAGRKVACVIANYRPEKFKSHRLPPAGSALFA